MKKFNEIRNNEKGFTLIELIIVIAILAIIAAVAIPNIMGAVDNSRKSTDVSNAKIIASAAAQVMAKNEDASGATYAVGSPLNVTTLTAAGAGANANLEFSQQLFVELNSNPPTPAYKGTNFTEDAFFLVLAADGTVSVYVDAAATADVSTNGNVLFPNPTADYDQD